MRVDKTIFTIPGAGYQIGTFSPKSASLYHKHYRKS